MDCIQLEKQPTASRYNLIENGDFTQAGSTDAAPYGWNPGDGSWVEMQESTNPINVLSYMYTIQGDPTKNKRLLQNVSAQGKKGDVYTLGGWVMGDSVPATEDDRMFGIIGQFNYTDGTSKQVKVTFDSDLKNDLIWRMSAIGWWQKKTITLSQLCLPLIITRIRCGLIRFSW